MSERQRWSPAAPVSRESAHDVGHLRAVGSKPAVPADDSFTELDGGSPGIERLKAHMRLVARDALVTVLILGESGTGKERVARAIHRASRRHEAPFVVVNCAGLTSTLLEDELFGHVRGAFTGAIDERAGPFERAHGGAVFLDEVGELTVESQTKLLRALQERTVQRLGSRRETTFDAQVIAATNVDLRRAVERGRFREDLYYRLTVYELTVPPLRSRGPRDVRALVDAILKRVAKQRGRRPPTVDPPLLTRLESHAWPGNVRELENTLERMVVAASGSAVLTTAHLPAEFGRPLMVRSDRSATSTGLPCSTTLSEAEIRDALARTDGRLGQAAAELGLSRHQLYRRIREVDSRDVGIRKEPGCDA
jgi:transcriptional regulator with PAS, ATPase and Fis domain